MTVIGISLTPEERYIRAMFDEATRAGDGSLRNALWKDLQRARLKGARHQKRPYARISLQEQPERVCGSCLVTNLRAVGWAEHPLGGLRPPCLGAEIACDLIFETDDPPCTRPGRHPHALKVCVEESHNSRTKSGKVVMRRLRRLAGPQPPIGTLATNAGSES
jgi:hypothetical protein